jgi:hypothetical protein
MGDIHRNALGRNQHLVVEIVDDELRIRIGIDTLKFAFEHGQDNNPWDDKSGDYVQGFVVSDAMEFAKDVRRELTREREDGSMKLTDLIDEMCMDAVEDGSIGVEENKRQRCK